ncbi:hypothetical protein HRI_000772900 [Hibiscus trionum]|uniref:Reverse transcriptase n=1 Tax=Hibiscus trionum TaxID=183268 RepID=A0A9W7H6J8_HIBTR|nr:hypothetical protein HRI_000772900 [Hibiscus trionum]
MAIEDTRVKNPGIRIGGLLKNTKLVVKSWATDLKSKQAANSFLIEKKITELELKLQNDVSRPDIIDELKRLRSELWSQYRREESEALQKSRLRWFSEGDWNSKFFHQSIQARRKVNAIQCLKIDNKVITDLLLIKEAIKNQFQEVYNSAPALEVDKMKLGFRKISTSQADFLQSAFREEEVRSVLFSCNGNRAPGPDGF